MFRKSLAILPLLLALLFCSTAAAQFTSNIQGTIQDASGAIIPGAKVTLLNKATGVEQATESGSTGVYRFASLPPGNYEITAQAQGFASRKLQANVITGQTVDLSFTLEVSSSSARVVVEASVAPIDTADARTYATLQATSMRDLPFPGRNYLGVAAVAPGVTGLGPIEAGGGSPGGVSDNFFTQVTPDVSGNGRNASGNSFKVDGLDVSSNISPGASNMAPNPDAVEELVVQTNTYTVENGKSSSVQISVSTKSGTNQFHGTGTYFFWNQNMWARTVFTRKYDPFKRHDLSGALGGPIVKNRTFFFGSVQPLWSTVTQSSSLSTFESPDFVAWAKQNFPNTIGTKLLTERPPVNMYTSRVSKTAQDIFGADCGGPATSNLPCSMPLIMEGGYNTSLYRNGLQYTIRGDQYLNNNRDRIFASFNQLKLSQQSLGTRLGFSSYDRNRSTGVQANWTHTFSGTLLNEFGFGYVVSGRPTFDGLPWDPSAKEEIPTISIANQSIGISPPTPGMWKQNNYDWRNVLTYVRGSHSLKFGFEAWKGDDDAAFITSGGRPSFLFNNLLDLVRDQPYQQTGPLYDPLTGEPGPNQYRYLLNTFGAFVQDTWKVKPNLTLTAGFRWDDYGNISRDPNKTTVFGHIALGPGSTMDQQFANASFTAIEHAYNGRLNKNFAPRIGFAWDPTKNAKWSVRGGFGLYRDWIPLGEENVLQNNNPLQLVSATIRRGSGIDPVFSLGTSRTFPYGFKLPSLPTKQLNDKGGIVGAQVSAGGIDPNIHAPYTFLYSAGVERQLPASLVAGVMYSGSRTYGANIATDFNRFPGDLLDGKLDRLNPNFGVMRWDYNANNITYNSMILSLRERFANGVSFEASYNLGEVTDYGQYGSRQDSDRPGSKFGVPSQHNVSKYLADSDWDVRHRFSLAGFFQVPVPKTSNALLKTVAGGWELTTVAIMQSGLPFTVLNTASFQPLLDASGNVIGYKPNSGDYNADGYNTDYPNGATRDFTGTHTRQQFLNGFMTQADFPAPAPGTEGNEKRNQYRGPGMLNVDAGMIKNNHLPFLGERGGFQLRFDFFNVLNRVNLRQVDTSLTSATFGRSTSTYQARRIQVGARITF